MRKMTITGLVMLMFFNVLGQGVLTGDLMVNTNLYDRDTIIGANTSQYQHELSSSEAWLFLNYDLNGFNFSVRYDLFNNSPLLDPNEVYTAQGIGYYQARKEFGKLEITAGHFYDQFGSGIIFRAFEDRNIGLDYAVNGLRVKFNASDKFRISGFTGKQKNRFAMHPQVLKGIDLEKDFFIGDNLQWLSGAAMLNRTIDAGTMNLIADEINSYKLADRFIPKYNTFAFSTFHTLAYKNFNLYLEYAYKTHEAIKDKEGGQLIDADGSVLYSSLNYSRKGFGFNLQYKNTRTFSLRTSPFTTLLVGTMNYLPAMSRQNAKTLLARYSISAQNFGEQGLQAEMTLSPNKVNIASANFSYIVDENNELLFRELYFDYYRRFNRSFDITAGLQNVYYNKKVYENHLDNYKDGTQEDPVVKTLVPFTEMVYKFNRKKSLRAELEYMFTRQDHGDFLFALAEYTIAPHWAFSVADMVNTKPKKLDKIEHYYNLTVVYTYLTTRFQIGYMKQVEGVVCTGGICRVEPAFSGLKFNLTTNF